MQVNELRPFSKRVDLKVKVLNKNETREVQSKLDNSTHKVTEAMVGDASGTILLTLWDDMIEKIEIGKSYAIGNAYTSFFQNKLRLNLGRFGTMEPSEEEVTEVDEANNLSEKEYERRPRFGGGGGPRRFDGRGGGRPPARDNDGDGGSDADSGDDSDDE